MDEDELAIQMISEIKEEEKKVIEEPLTLNSVLRR